MKIALDFDGVLINTMHSFLKIYNNKSNDDFEVSDIHEYDFLDILDINEKRMNKIFKKVYEHVENIPVVEDDACYSAFLLNRKHDIDIVTSTYASKKQVLLKLGMMSFIRGNEFNELIMSDDKMSLDYDVFIDDCPYVANWIGERVLLLFDRPWNKHVKQAKNVMRVYSWKDVRNRIEMLEKR